MKQVATTSGERSITVIYTEGLAPDIQLSGPAVGVPLSLNHSEGTGGYWFWVAWAGDGSKATGDWGPQYKGLPGAISEKG